METMRNIANRELAELAEPKSVKVLQPVFNQIGKPKRATATNEGDAWAHYHVVPPAKTGKAEELSLDLVSVDTLSPLSKEATYTINISLESKDDTMNIPTRIEQLTNLFNKLVLNRMMERTCSLCITGPMTIGSDQFENDLPEVRLLDYALEQALAACRVSLEELRCEKCHMSYQGWGINALACSLDDHEHLKVLKLIWCKFNHAGAHALGDVFQFMACLRELTVANGMLDSLSVRHLIMPLNPEHALAFLDLSCNLIDASAAAALAMLLRSYPHLKTLILAHNKLGSGLETISPELSTNDTLTHLDVSHNQIRQKGATALASALKHNRTMLHLNISDNNIANEGMQEFQELFKSGHYLKKFVFWDDAVSEEARLNLLFSMNRKTMDLIHFESSVKLESSVKSEPLVKSDLPKSSFKLACEQDCLFFFYRPLCFSIWSQWFQAATESNNDSDTVWRPDPKTKVSKQLTEQLILHRNSLSNRRGNESKQSMCHVQRCDARDALRLAVCMLQSAAVAHSHANPFDSAWIVDQMLGKDGKRGIVVEIKRDFDAIEPNQLSSAKPLSYWDRPFNHPGEHVLVQEAEYLIDLWSCGEHAIMYE